MIFAIKEQVVPDGDLGVCRQAKDRAEKFGKELSNLTRPRLHESSEIYRFCDAQNEPYNLFDIVRQTGLSGRKKTLLSAL